MFDGKKIAKRALLRIEEIESKKRRRYIKRKTIVLLGLCAASVVIVLLIFPFGNFPDDYIFLDDEPVPLAALTFPETDENAEPYTGTEQGVTIPEIEKVITVVDNVDIIVLLHNPKENPYDFIFEIALSETTETLYKSGLIEPDMCVKNPASSRVLEKGEYNAVLKIYFYDIETFTSTNSVEINFILSAE